MQDVEIVDIKLSLDRLKNVSLIYNSIATMDYFDPFGFLLPKDTAQAFLRFVGDSRNQLKENLRRTGVAS
jgi:hypothetical protein